MDVISMNDFSREQILAVLNTADDVREAIHNPRFRNQFKKRYNTSIEGVLRGTKVASLFMENSTRTHYSFRYAVGTAGGYVDGFPSEDYTSLQKGETWASTAAMFANWGCDALVMRSKIEGFPRWTKETLQQNHHHVSRQHATLGLPFNYAVPLIINGGDGRNQHPTQCFLDLMTIRQLARVQGRDLDGLNIALLNDLAHGRTNASLMSVAHHFDWKVHVAYPERFGPQARRLEELKLRGVEFHDHQDNFKEAMAASFVAYHSRPQKERVGQGEDLIRIKQLGQITRQLYDSLGEGAPYLLHPLPVDAVTFAEIAADMDFHPKNMTRIQSENGLYVRIALLALGLGKFQTADYVSAPLRECTSVEVKELALSTSEKSLDNPRSGYIKHTGVVLDHIPAGMVRRLEGILGFEGSGLPTVASSNIPVNDRNSKDMLKIHLPYEFTDDQYEVMTLLAPQLTISFIEEGVVRRKVRPVIGNHLVGKIRCCNDACVTNIEHEPIIQQHHVERINDQILLTCHYCETPDRVEAIYRENRFIYLFPS